VTEPERCPECQSTRTLPGPAYDRSRHRCLACGATFDAPNEPDHQDDTRLNQMTRNVANLPAASPFPGASGARWEPRRTRWWHDGPS
jgi:hypothetical protein